MGVLRLCATPLRRLRGPVVGEHRGVPLDRLPTVSDFLFVRSGFLAVAHCKQH